MKDYNEKGVVKLNIFLVRKKYILCKMAICDIINKQRARN